MTTTDLDTHLAHLRLRSLAPGTIRNRHLALRRLARYLAIDPSDLTTVTREQLDSWQHSIVSMSPRYRASYISHVFAFYSWLAKAEIIEENTAAILVKPKVSRGLPHPIAESDLQFALLDAPERLRLMLFLAAFAGLRAMEIAFLTREQVRDTAEPPMLWIVGKGNKERLVPLSDLMLTELRVHGLPSRGYVFPRGDGLPGCNSPARVSQICNAYLHGRGVAESLHSLRHRFGTRLYQLSTDLRMVQEVMGHSDPATTAGYAAHSPAAAVRAVELLGEHRRAAPVVVAS